MEILIRQQPQIVSGDYSMNFHLFGACDGSLESSNPTLFNLMGQSHFNTSYSIRSCSFLSKIFLLILTGSIASKGITHLKRWISQVISVNPPTPLIVIDDSSTLSAQDDHLLQVDSTTPRFNYKTPLFVEIELVPEFEERLDNGMSTMTMNCSYSM